jgi:4-amino-4-deoxy-L-arabinose transferase-like glycosyltransferase
MRLRNVLSRLAAGFMVSVSTRQGSLERAADRLALVVLFAVGAVALATFRHYGLGWDDFTHAQMGEKLVALYASGFRDSEALSFVNLYMYGGGFDVVSALAAKILPFSLFETRRLIGALVGIAGLAVTWRIGRRVGGPVAGLIALVLLATCPIYIGHMFMNAKDAPFAVAMAVLLLGLVRVFQEYPRPTPATVLIFGCGLGLTLGTRIMGGIAGVYAATAFAFVLVLEAHALGLRAAAARGGRLVLTLLPGLLVGYLVMGLLWPWSVISPLNPLRAIEYFSVFFEKPWREVFDGKLIAVPDMPASYLPTLLALQLPEIMTALGIGGAVLALRRALDRSAALPARAVHVLMFAAVAAPIAIALVTRPAMYNGFRHFLFLLPPLAVLGGLAGAWLFELASRRRATLVGATAVIAAGAISPVVEMVRLHPYEYTHFNRIEGGVRAAENHYMLDYWGLSFKQAAQQLRATLTARMETPPAGRRWKIAVCGPHPPAAVELGPEFEPTWDVHGADFALMLGVYYCNEFKAPVLAEVKRDGVTYARAYDVRERSFTTLLTQPPP